MLQRNFVARMYFRIFAEMMRNISKPVFAHVSVTDQNSIRPNYFSSFGRKFFLVFISKFTVSPKFFPGFTLVYGINTHGYKLIIILFRLWQRITNLLLNLIGWVTSTTIKPCKLKQACLTHPNYFLAIGKYIKPTNREHNNVTTT